MTDVAKAAGVSQTTVSLILNNVAGARLSADTRQRVRQAADELGYDLVRRSVARPKVNNTIGFVADEIATDPWSAQALEAVHEQVWQNGLLVSASFTKGDADLEAAVREQMAGLPLRGLIFATILTRRVTDPGFSRRLPVVLLNCYVADNALPSVVPGELLGGYTATRHLIRAGHQRIAHIHGQSWMDASRDRLKGYRRALSEAEIPFDPELVRPGNWETRAGYEQTLALLALEDRPTAIFCANDLMAFGCYEALAENGLRVPDDMSVVGYDDREIARDLRPALTTVLLPHADMAAQATELLFDQIEPQNGRYPRLKVECPLVERSSVAPPRR
ncbi:LacI family DNA-binding transcriptional regulator [Bauldia sp.]|uniref:LacI family DNA-binding transcriptional regulator n=1 Tax=Bauldia sp. TaxID=2575872 RepID=UPI003BA8AC89